MTLYSNGHATVQAAAAQVFPYGQHASAAKAAHYPAAAPPRTDLEKLLLCQDEAEVKRWITNKLNEIGVKPVARLDIYNPGESILFRQVEKLTKLLRQEDKDEERKNACQSLIDRIGHFFTRDNNHPRLPREDAQRVFFSPVKILIWNAFQQEAVYTGSSSK